MSMPRRVLGCLIAVLGAVTLYPFPSASADDRNPPEFVLARADAILDGRAGPEYRKDASMALRDVFVARPTMAEQDRRRAGLLLARPTDRGADAYSDGYVTPATRICRARVCVHYVRTTNDAPPDRAWVRTTLRVMLKVWRIEVGRLGFRPPPQDGDNGGDDRFDVYLKDLGERGLYGYCAPEYQLSDQRRVASGYCVLDNDFARSQFHADPKVSLRVTAAHEFFHAVQFGYDFREDPWLLESTATWMEERVADNADDNRRYLRYGQMGRPGASLDRFDRSGYSQYGNWAFWEFLSSKLGDRVVRKVWDQAGAYDGAPDRYSVAALKRVLDDHGGLPARFAAYADAIGDARHAFPEGASWPTVKRSRPALLGPENPYAKVQVQVDHLASRSLVARPGPGVVGAGWRLEVTVNAPSWKTGPAAYLRVVRRDGTVRSRPIELDALGFGWKRAKFDVRTVRRVTVTVANTSTRYRCGQRDTAFACDGKPVDQKLPFEIRTRVYRS